MNRAKSKRRRGFTLLELLIVIGIIVLIASLTIPALTGLTKSNNLGSGGRLFTNLFTIARSEAINRRALIRFEVATNWPNDQTAAYRKITLVQHDATNGTDVQIAKWETLPVGIIFQPQDPTPGQGTYFFALNQTQNPPLKVGGQDVTTTYIEFMPTGAINVPPASSPIRLRIAPGYVSPSNAVILTTSTNWLEASVDNMVGRIKISRP